MFIKKMYNLYRKVVFFFTVVLKVFHNYLNNCYVKEIFRCFLSIKMYSHIVERVFMFRPASLGSLYGKIPAWRQNYQIQYKKSAPKLGHWDLKPGGFQNMCQIKPRLNYQPLFRKMSPHSSPRRSGWTHAISHLSSGRIKDRTRETAEIKPNKTKKADYFCHGILYPISCLCCTLLLPLFRW